MISWAVTPEKVERAIQTIVALEHPSRVVLFGSVVLGTLHSHSDLDILVVTSDEVESPRKESVRIRRALRGLSMPMDIVVVSERRLRELANQPGLIYGEALRRGRVVYAAAA